MKQNTEQLAPTADDSINQSIFFDRHDGPFTRWVEEQGLPADASDELVIDAMTSFLQSRNTPSISD